MTKAYLVTGASTGVGRDCVLRLATRGHLVFAGVRKTTDGESLVNEKKGNIVPVLLDVTKPEMITSALQTIESTLGKEAGLDGLVNNAGIVVVGPLELLSQDQMRHQFEVNLFGPLALIQATLPLLRSRKGRIVNVGSIMGRVPWPLSGAYVASKHALAGMTDTLGLELESSGISVSLIEPSAIATAIWGKVFEQSDELKGRNHPSWSYYEKKAVRVEAQVRKSVKLAVAPSVITDVIEHALFSPRPKHRYLVGMGARVQGLIRKILPGRWFLGLVKKIT